MQSAYSNYKALLMIAMNYESGESIAPQLVGVQQTDIER